jgi:hypothetical protein
MKIRKNGKVINLTESDLKRIVKKVLTEDAPYDTMVNVEDLEFKIFVNHKDITGSVSEPKIVGNSEGYFMVEVESDEGVFETDDIIGLQITGGNLGGGRREWGGNTRGKKGSGDGVVYFTEVGDTFEKDWSKYKDDGISPYFQVVLTDTNLEIEEGQQPTLVVRVHLNGRDRDFDEFGQEEKLKAQEEKLKAQEEADAALAKWSKSL